MKSISNNVLKELNHRINEYAKFNIDRLPYSTRVMIKEVINCLSAGAYPVYRYELKFIKGSENQTLVEVTIPDSPRLETLISCIQRSGTYGTYGNIGIKICQAKYNSRDPFKFDKDSDSFITNLRYQSTIPDSLQGDTKLIEKFNHVRVSQLQCTIDKIPINDYTYKMDWLIIIPGIYSESLEPEPEECFHDGTFGPVGYKIPDDMIGWINNKKDRSEDEYI